MKKQKAIKILQHQLDLLQNPENLNSSWKLTTRTYIDKFFGHDSLHSAKAYQISVNNISSISGTHNSENLNNIKTFLRDSITTIKNIGVYKPPTKNWFSHLPNWGINLGLSALAFISFAIGNISSDIKNYNLEKENKELKELLTPTLSDSISNSIKDE